MRDLLHKFCLCGEERSNSVREAGVPPNVRLVYRLDFLIGASESRYLDPARYLVARTSGLINYSAFPHRETDI